MEKSKWWFPYLKQDTSHYGDKHKRGNVNYKIKRLQITTENIFFNNKGIMWQGRKIDQLSKWFDIFGQCTLSGNFNSKFNEFWKKHFCMNRCICLSADRSALRILAHCAKIFAIRIYHTIGRRGGSVVEHRTHDLKVVCSNPGRVVTLILLLVKFKWALCGCSLKPQIDFCGDRDNNYDPKKVLLRSAI